MPKRNFGTPDLQSEIIEMRLSKREKYAVIIAGVFVFVFILLQLIIFPFREKKERLERAVQAASKSLEEMISLKAEYGEFVQKAEISKIRFANREPGFTLFSFLDRLAGEEGLKENIAYMKPSKSESKDSQYKLSQVEMKLQGLSMKQLSPYLYKVETSKNSVFVRRLSITKKGKEEGFIDVILQVETYEI